MAADRDKDDLMVVWGLNSRCGFFIFFFLKNKLQKCGVISPYWDICEHI